MLPARSNVSALNLKNRILLLVSGFQPIFGGPLLNGECVCEIVSLNCEFLIYFRYMYVFFVVVFFNFFFNLI